MTRRESEEKNFADETGVAVPFRSPTTPLTHSSTGLSLQFSQSLSCSYAKTGVWEGGRSRRASGGLAMDSGGGGGNSRAQLVNDTPAELCIRDPPTATTHSVTTRQSAVTDDVYVDIIGTFHRPWGLASWREKLFTFLRANLQLLPFFATYLFALPYPPLTSPRFRGWRDRLDYPL
ncbi:unnamed protein product [Mesocestoides corti]|uniref:Uncharacterized protein n=1 Tax=Mesocestoides corti TaxID=53468 RepID=A0A0R3UCI8_MESCO|nr:unnamed protein product [Mesocestoides corti]